MGRLSRVELQKRNRARVLDAAREEFIEHGYRDAKIDGIAERADLTRGAVYSNFTGKRGLYFAVLAELTDSAPDAHQEPGRTPGEALASLARAWFSRLAAGQDSPLGMNLMSEILADERTRRPFAQLMKLDAILLGFALEQLRPAGRMVRVAETVLTMLQGASQLTAAAPGFVEPFNVARACEQLASLDLADQWARPPSTPPVRPDNEPWTPPPAIDAVSGQPARLAEDGVVAILGLNRLAAAEDVVRTAPAEAQVTAVLVTGDPSELAPLARLVVAELCGCLRQAFPPSAWPRLQVIHEESGMLAAAAGVTDFSDGTEAAVRIEAGRIVARADGFGACHAAAAVDLSATSANLH
ncbi:MAG TPA: TetR/AcrR family transcriptional regulator [Kribbella sp.]